MDYRNIPLNMKKSTVLHKYNVVHILHHHKPAENTVWHTYITMYATLLKCMTFLITYT